jgi:hypothetical protein
MKKMFRILLIIVIIGVVAFVAAYLYMNKPHPDYAGLTPDYTVNAEKLFNEFREDAETASAKYNGKMIEITGKPHLKEIADSLHIIVYAFEEGMFGAEGIRCTLLPGFHDKIDENSFSDNFSIKGYCAGYNDTDVILEKCSVNVNKF